MPWVGAWSSICFSTSGRPDIAGADGVAGDAVLGALERRDLGEPDQPVLGGDVGRLERRGDQPVRRGDIDDPAETALLHAGENGAAGVKGGGQIDRENGVPLL